MNKDPAFLFYSNDFLSGTYTMDNEQVGKYIKLLCLQHQKGRLSKKDMLKICITYDEDIFSKFIKDSAHKYYNKRLEEESIKRKNYADSRRKNRMAKSYVKHMVNENVNEDINIDDYKGFNIFWDLYDKKVDKLKCEKKWYRLNIGERAAVIKYLPSYIKSQPNKQYRKNPATFLNNRSWENEIINDKPKSEFKPIEGTGRKVPNYEETQKMLKELRS